MDSKKCVTVSECIRNIAKRGGQVSYTNETLVENEQGAVLLEMKPRSAT